MVTVMVRNRMLFSVVTQINSALLLFLIFLLVKGKINLSEVRVYDTLAQAQKGLWWVSTYRDLFLNHLRGLTPAPTAIVLNQKPWVTPFRKSNILMELPGAVRAGLEVVDSLVWLQGAPSLAEAKDKKIMTSEVDNLMRNVLCNSSHPRSVTVYRNGSNFTCVFVDFPPDLYEPIFKAPEHFFHDGLHFAGHEVYLRRNRAALEAAGVKNLPQHPHDHEHEHDSDHDHHSFHGQRENHPKHLMEASGEVKV